MAYFMTWQRKKKVIVPGNHEYMATIFSEVLYFVGQPVPVDGRVVSIDRLEQFESLDTTETTQ